MISDDRTLADLYRRIVEFDIDGEPAEFRSHDILPVKMAGPSISLIELSVNTNASSFFLRQRVKEKALGSEHPSVAASLENYAALRRETGRSDEAAKMEARAEAIRAKHAKENPAN